MTDVIFQEMQATFIKIPLTARPPTRKKFIRCSKDTLEILVKPSKGGKAEDIIDIRTIHEVRKGNDILREERIVDASVTDAKMCFTIVYGSEFRLKFGVFICSNWNIREFWSEGLLTHMQTIAKLDTNSHTRIWLMKEFNELDRNQTSTIGTNDLKKTFFNRIQLKIPREKQHKLIADLDTKNVGYVYFPQFRQFYHKKLVFNEDMMKLLSHCMSFQLKNSWYISSQELCAFLQSEQFVHHIPITTLLAEKMIRPYLLSEKPLSTPNFPIDEFFDYLFSRGNSLFDDEYTSRLLAADPNYMDYSMSEYWINSSHNTYLTGNQYASESTVEAYIRVMRSGCRCIELDLWDGGPDDLPWITHGHTRCTKIKFRDIVIAIREHAFATSDYPMILSLEEHCSIPIQKNTAYEFKKILGDLLLTEPVKGATCLPSPNQLKRKVILKHKKLPEGSDETVVLTDTGEAQVTKQQDISNSQKNGFLYLKDPGANVWTRRYFVLTDKILSYCIEEDDQEQDTENVRDHIYMETVPSHLKHINHVWYHVVDRDGAVDKLKEFEGGNGSFLVRPNDKYEGYVSISFKHEREVYHSLVKRIPSPDGLYNYQLVHPMTFDDIPSLVDYYKCHPLRASTFEQILTTPCPCPSLSNTNHEAQPWFHAGMKRWEAEKMLTSVRLEGAFLVRPSGEQSTYTITFRTENEIKHCRVEFNKDSGLYTIGTAQFESLSELVVYYKSHPLYRKMKLKHAINESMLKNIGVDAEASAEAEYISVNPVTYRSIHAFTAQNKDELSFPAGVEITNVIEHQHTKGWFQGDFGGKVNLWFPENHVKRFDATTPLTPMDPPKPELDNQEETIRIENLEVTRVSPHLAGREWVLRLVQDVPVEYKTLKPESSNALFVGCENEEDFKSWESKLNEVKKELTRSQSLDARLQKRTSIAREMSDLIIYCRSVPFRVESIGNGKFSEMSSFPETKAFHHALNRETAPKLVIYNQQQFSRVYPKGSRIDSSNYLPIPLWNMGCQMVALNFQTPDKAMQVNDARFLVNNKLGFVLKPAFMRMKDTKYNPLDPKTVPTPPTRITIRVLGGRHLFRIGRGFPSCRVTVEIVGADYDNQYYMTSNISDNCLNPVWEYKSFEFSVKNPECAFLRFVVHDIDMFGDPNQIGQATYPLTAIRPGFRSVQLKTPFSEELELSSLLVYVILENGEKSQSDSTEIKSRIDKLKDELRGLYSSGDLRSDLIESKRRELQAAQNQMDRVSQEMNRINTLRK
ncbi:1-phosphatidylinositol 4,5-bisphosphate phosphodiesterase gamma-1-like [Oopsacas minuta]|uniref:Phosphoinositide phospholipase C n=1 Tax=Oopsacas minuta TaxID=111878 RepID=A0AAV7K1Z3_9METZ|nr:1-phosphatidylinositol 4,5-bisphosphate phosphodiesterase gamma-1-like [Oopsacas minuta]